MSLPWAAPLKALVLATLLLGAPPVAGQTPEVVETVGTPAGTAAPGDFGPEPTTSVGPPTPEALPAGPTSNLAAAPGRAPRPRVTPPPVGLSGVEFPGAPFAASEDPGMPTGSEGMPLPDPTAPGDTAWEQAEGAPEPSHWQAEPGAHEASGRRLSLTGMELPQVSPELHALQLELAALPHAIQPSAATEVGFILTDLAAAGLALGSLGTLTAVDREEQALYVLVTALSVVMLPIGAITWLVGEIIDGQRRHALEERRVRLMHEIDRELSLRHHGW